MMLFIIIIIKIFFYNLIFLLRILNSFLLVFFFLKMVSIINNFALFDLNDHLYFLYLLVFIQLFYHQNHT